MLKIQNKLLHLYSKIIGSIAFYPVVITIIFSVFAVIMLQIENYGISKYIGKNVQYIIVNNKDTARTILSTLIGGIMSIMVFSFSMVMLLLNQASSNFSPRVLPSLIANKRHQFVLGVFIGTIVYCLLISINILPNHRTYSVPGVATFVGVLLGLFCLALFVYFLHSISKSIQIGYILENLYKDTLQEIESEIEKNNQRINELPKHESWQMIYSTETGYLQKIIKPHLLDVAKKHKTSILIFLSESRFIIKDEPIGKITNNLDEEARKEISSCLLFNSEERIEQNFATGFKQITEIVVKAMSPGINDPGTALVGIDYLSELFRKRMQLPDNVELSINSKKSDDKKHDEKVYLKNTSFEEIFYLNIVAIRQYIRHDVVVLLRLLDFYKSLLNVKNIAADKENFLKKQLKSLLSDIKEHITNEGDRDYLIKIGSKLLTDVTQP
jgi:uncharacterized membrane protein